MGKILSKYKAIPLDEQLPTAYAIKKPIYYTLKNTIYTLSINPTKGCKQLPPDSIINLIQEKNKITHSNKGTVFTYNFLGQEYIAGLIELDREIIIVDMKEFIKSTNKIPKIYTYNEEYLIPC